MAHSCKPFGPDKSYMRSDRYYDDNCRIAHYFKQTNAIITSFWFQQSAHVTLLVIFIGRSLERCWRSPGADLKSILLVLNLWYPFLDFWLVIDGALHFVISATLWCLILAARWSRNHALGHWTVDVGDLTAGGPRYNRKSKRLSCGELTQTMGRFISDAFFRRVQ